MIRVSTLYPVYCSGTAVSHICLSLCEHMRGASCDVRLWTPACDAPGRGPFVREAIPPLVKGIAYKLDPSSRNISRILHWRYLHDLRPGDIAYLWPATPLPVYRALKERGQTIVLERINCHRATSKRILDDAYARQGWPVTHDVTQRGLEEEFEKLRLADLVFSPSPLVAQSLLEAGVPEEKILAASYGWSPERLRGTDRALPPAEGVTMLFVGRIGVRKGTHLLLKYWEQAAIKGRLVLAGRIEEDFATRCGDALKRPGVTHLGFTADIGAVYRSADALVFPSLEEGSPLVIYEALASRLPVAVSPMGAGGIARDGQDGFVLDPYDEPRWIDALRRLAADAALRKHFGDSGAAQARNYTWAHAGAKRRELIEAALARR